MSGGAIPAGVGRVSEEEDREGESKRQRIERESERVSERERESVLGASSHAHEPLERHASLV